MKIIMATILVVIITVIIMRIIMVIIIVITVKFVIIRDGLVINMLACRLGGATKDASTSRSPREWVTHVGWILGSC